MRERLRSYFLAAEQALLTQDYDWWDDLHDTKDYSSFCGESFRLENLSFCAHFPALLGYCHARSGRKAKNAIASPWYVKTARLSADS